MLRLAALLALVLGLGGFGGYLVLMGKSPLASLEARHLRDMKDRRDSPRSYAPMTVAEFTALPRSAPVAEYSGLERRGVALEGYLQRMQRASDGDVHFELVERLPVAYKEPYVTAEVAPNPGGSSGWSWSTLEWELRPWRSPAMDVWNTPPPRVRVSGWLLYDFQHEEGPPATGASEPRVSAWEIHPVTAIELWNETSRTWKALAR